MKIISIAILAIATMLNAHAFSNNQNSINGLLRIYGYLLGQDNSLKIIEESYPELKQSANISRLRFESSYPRLKEKASEMIIALGGEQGKKIIENINEKMAEQPPKTFLKNQAMLFLLTVSLRSEGKFDDKSTGELMLALNYFDNPEREISDKKYKKFNTKNEIKAKGLDLNIILPTSWSEQEGSSPNTIKSWTSEAGLGISMINLLVRNTDDTRTKAEVRRAVERKELDNMVHPKAVVNKITYAEVGMQPGWYAETEIQLQRLDLDLYTINKNLYILYDGKIIELGCASFGLLSKKDQLIKESTRVGDLCRLVFLSLMINNLYQ